MDFFFFFLWQLHICYFIISGVSWTEKIIVTVYHQHHYNHTRDKKRRCISLSRDQIEIKVDRLAFVCLFVFSFFAVSAPCFCSSHSRREQNLVQQGTMSFSPSLQDNRQEQAPSSRSAAGRAFGTQAYQVLPFVYLCLHYLQNIFLHILTHVLLCCQLTEEGHTRVNVCNDSIT